MFGNVMVLDVGKQTVYQVIPTDIGGNTVLNFDGTLLAAVGNWTWKPGRDGQVEVWRTLDGGLLYRNKLSNVRSMALDAGGSYVAIAQPTQVLKIDLDRATSPSVFELGGQIRVSAFSPDAQFFACNLSDQSILLIHDLRECRRKHAFQAGQLDLIAYSPDSTIVAAASADYAIHLWDTEAVGRFSRTLRGHSRQVTDIQISRDNQTLMSKSTNGMIRLWRVQDGFPICALRDFPLRTVFSPDGRTFAHIQRKRQWVGHFLDLTFRPDEGEVKIWRVNV